MKEENGQEMKKDRGGNNSPRNQGTLISRRFVLPLLLGVAIVLCAFFTRVYTAMPWQEDALLGLPVYQWRQSVAVGFFSASAWGAMMAAGCVFWLLLTPLTGAHWTGGIRQIWLRLSGSGMVAWLFLFCVVGSMGTVLFPWMAEIRRCSSFLLWEWGGDELVQALNRRGLVALAERSWFVNMPFFFSREFLYGLLLVLIPAIWKNSFEMTGDGVMEIRRRQRLRRVYSALLLPLVAVSIGMMGGDWTNVSGTAWIPSLFPLAFLASAAVMGLALSCCFAPMFRYDGRTTPRLGALLLVGIMFKIYLWYSLYMLIWYARIPEEALFFSARLQGEWGRVASICSFGNVAVLLLVLIPYIRKSARMLCGVGVVLSILGAVEAYWLIAPVMGVQSPGGMSGGVFAVSMVVIIAFMLLLFVSSKKGRDDSDRTHHLS